MQGGGGRVSLSSQDGSAKKSLLAAAGIQGRNVVVAVACFG